MEIILDAQGFKKPCNEFVVKELAAISIQNDDADGLQRYTCIFFESPCDWNSLPEQYQCMNSWITRNYHGIPWGVGRMPYGNLKHVLDVILEDKAYVYVKGSEKKEWLQSIVGRSKIIIDMENLNCPSLRYLQTLNCYGCDHHAFHRAVYGYNCAFENVQRLKSWFLKHCVSTPSLERSLKIYNQLGMKNIADMKAEDVACLPKSFILKNFANRIEEIWNELTDMMREDEDIAGQRRCRKHYETRAADSDEFDGPIPLVKNCLKCQKEKIEK